MSDEIAIKVDGVYKDFLLPHERADSIKSAFTGLLKGKKGRTIEKQHALNNISFNIKKGEFFGIVGRNGSGKSTLLKILANIYQPTKGSVSINGRLVPFIELGVGFNPELTGRENVFLSAALLGFSQKEVEAMYQSIVDFAELEKFMDQKLKNYSSGMQVRLAFSVAVRAEADILLIDEVLAVGDADFQRKCFDYFKTLKKNKKTVVFVSHDMSAIREYCDEVVLIEDSKLVQKGPADKIASLYTKLFNTSSSLAHASEGERWGDGGVITKKVDVEVQTKTLRITQTIKASQTQEDTIAGIRIKDSAGNHVLGTNTKLERIKLGTLEENQELTIYWDIINILSDGQYWLDLSIHHGDGVTVSDWWDDCAKLTVTKARHLPYAVDPGFSITVNNK
jgi:ABC-2 type transport system ATP-binding protein